MFIIDNQIRDACKKYFEDVRRYKDEQIHLYNTILYFIHSAPNLSVIFLHWANLNIYEKLILNVQMKYCFPTIGKVFYPPLVCAFQCWDMWQNTYGALGYTSNPLTNGISEGTDREIVKILSIMGKVMEQIENKQNVVEEIKLYNEPQNILFHYTSNFFCKSNIRKRSCLTRRSNDNISTSDDDNYSTDLNGCGDATWVSDIE